MSLNALPVELQQVIYNFDGRYKAAMAHCLRIIRQRRTSLCIIDYNLDRCTPEQVTEVFNIINDEDNVDIIKILDKTNQKTGRPFKIFFISFKLSTDNLAAVIDRIEEEGFIYVKYHALRDPWKVTLAKKEKGHRIMGRDE
jgi:hypothetical protein